MAKKILCALLAVLMLVGIAACAKEEAPVDEPAKELDYTFGLNETFHSNEPVTYSMYFSDASWYPLVETWETEGVFKKIEEMTNVKLDLTSYDSNDYTNKITLDINAGSSKYIIPKVYDESAFVDGGAVVAVSDYVEYMPNYTGFVEEFGLQPDLETITRADGKYYRLPGMHEAPFINYAFIIRKDLFDAAGVDVASLEATWTWDGLLEALQTVKAYMVENGLCKEKDYIWSDLWSGAESGQNSGGNLLKLMASTYNVKAGWAVSPPITYNAAKDEWNVGAVTAEYKQFLSMARKFVDAGILDPETFTQDDTTAHNKFYNGQTVIMATNQGQYLTDISGVTEVLGEGNFEISHIVTPMGNCKYISENTRLENGVMIAQNALDELGEDGFIKMMRFVDWLWYSDEAYTLIKWGVEGEHYNVVDGQKVLLPGFKCGGLGIAGAEEDVDIRLQWGYAGGNLFYGHRAALRDDNLLPAIQDIGARTVANREIKPLDPTVIIPDDEVEMVNLWQTSLVDTINTWTLNFITGQKDIEADWDAYVAECEAANMQNYIDSYNSAYKG